jgi:predicted signal transduction protein with EAL and GGDEF domain
MSRKSPMSISKRIALWVLAAMAVALALSAAAVLWLRGEAHPTWQLYSALVVAQVLPCAGLLLLLAKLRPYAFGPQAQLVRQLTAVGEGRYEHCVQPEAIEWAEPFRAANVMVARLVQRRAARDKQLSLLREEVDTDSLTGLASRAQFMQTLASTLAGAEALPERANKRVAQRGMVAIVRVHDLVGVNQRMGRERGDELLASIAMLLRMHLMRLGTADALLARLNGADFAVITPSVPEGALSDWLEDLALGFTDLHHNAVADRPHVAWIGATSFSRGEPVSDVMSRADAMVQSSESQKLPFRLTNAMESDHAIPTAQWRLLIERALDTGLVSLAYFPVLTCDGHVLHREAVVRVTLADGAVMTGARVVPPALRTGRIMDLDLRVIELALVELAAHPQASDLSVNVSPQSLARPLFVERLRAVLANAPAVASRLWIEVDEAILGHVPEDLDALLSLTKPFGMRVGLDHFQSQWTQAFQLPARGVSFIKLDAGLCVGLAARGGGLPSRGRHDFASVLRGLLGDSAPCQVIATGLKKASDVSAAWDANFDAATGPELTRLTVAKPAAPKTLATVALEPLTQEH